MDIDLAALRALEREKDIPLDLLVRTIEQALLLAYHRTDGALTDARVELDRTSGHVVVWAQELDAAGNVAREWDDTPHDFGRIAAMTAKQVILQRLREATDEAHFGEYVGRDGDLVTGVIQAHEGRAEKGIVSVDLGKIEAMLPPGEQVPGELYEHGTRIKCVVLHVTRGFLGVIELDACPLVLLLKHREDQSGVGCPVSGQVLEAKVLAAWHSAGH